MFEIYDHNHLRFTKDFWWETSSDENRNLFFDIGIGLRIGSITSRLT